MHKIVIVVGECQWCNGTIVLFDGSTCGPCPHCNALYGIAKNQRPAGFLALEWLLLKFKSV